MRGRQREIRNALNHEFRQLVLEGLLTRIEDLRQRSLHGKLLFGRIGDDRDGLRRIQRHDVESRSNDLAFGGESD
jgi:hypothetical protein